MIAAGQPDLDAEGRAREQGRQLEQEGGELEGSQEKLDVRSNDNDDHSFEQSRATKAEMGPHLGCSISVGEEDELRGGGGEEAKDNSNNKEDRSCWKCDRHKEEKEEILALGPMWRPDMAALTTSEDNMTRCERNKWAPAEREPKWRQQTSGRDGLMQIVESAERKLMMKRRSGLAAADEEAQSGSGASSRRTSMMLLKSPAFATNTLDASQLERLAESGPKGDALPLAEVTDRPDYDESDRGAPTPTNELVRALRKRDQQLARGRPEADQEVRAGASKRKPRVKVTGDDAGEERDERSQRAPRGRDLDKGSQMGAETGLLALISRCHLSSSDLSGARSDTTSGPLRRPRTPSDPNPLVGAAGRQGEPATPRRHSTYMLPLVLDDQRRRRRANLLGRHQLDSDCSLSESSTSSGSPSPQPAADPEHLSASASLANSASSPSDLSTPTNERGTGCGGPCCSLGQTNKSPPVGQQQQPHQQQRSPTRQTRLGSNPLDRFIGQHGHRKSQSLRPAQAPASAKRHSIISILRSPAGHPGGCNPHHLVSRLSNPRQFFTGSSTSSTRSSIADCASPTRRTSQPTGSSQCDGQEHYDPLIPESGFKIVVMGTSGSGKSSIIKRFLYDTFDSRHFPTVEDTYFIEFPYMKNIINISISDTSGTYQFPAMRRLAINSGDAFVLVYSVDNPNSLDDLKQLRQSILEEREQAYLEASLMSSRSSSLCSSSNLTDSSASGLSGSQEPVCGPSGLDYASWQGNNCSMSASKQAAEQAIPAGSINARHWSLASLFGHHHHHHHQHQQQQQQQTVLPSLNANYANHQHLNGDQQHPPTDSYSSSSSSFSCSAATTADSSRRSSISAAEAALKTRRTRRPPMVIVANKIDLPEEKHLMNSDEMEALAVIDWNNGFVRASAALNLNINDIFQQVLRQAKQPPTLSEAIVSKRRRSLPPKLPNSIVPVPLAGQQF